MSRIIRNMIISGTGSYVPENVITNDTLAKTVATSSEWIETKLGIKKRHVAPHSVFSSELAYEAARRALADARLSPMDIDLIIVATATPDRKAPSTACLVQNKLQAYKAAAFDLGAVCSGFLFALSTASQFITNGTYQHILVIGVDTFSKITDWTRRDCVFFGDGAGAVVVSKYNDGGLFSFDLYSDGKGQDAFTVYEEDKYFTMDGKAVYDTAMEVLPKAINSLLRKVGMTIDEVDYMVPHQPGISVLKGVAEKIGIPFNKVAANMDKYANTAGASIPLLLDELSKRNKLQKGDNILFAAIGSGWTYGAAMLRWERDDTYWRV